MRNRQQLHSELIDAVEQLPERDVEALLALVEDEPGLLRQALAEYGYIETSSGEAMDDGLVMNRDAQSIPEPQQELIRHIEGKLDPPKTTDEVVDIVGSEDSAFREQYNSAQYRSWLSEQLNGLVEQGEIGRYRDGRQVYYTETPALGVRHWCRLNELFPDDLTVADVVDIKDDTGMPSKQVKTAIDSLRHD